MMDAQHAVREVAACIPAEVCARFEIVPKLSDEDRKTVTELAHQALARFQPRAASELEAMAAPAPELVTRPRPELAPAEKS